MESYVIANARIVSPADGLDVTGSVRIAGGKIVSVGPLPEIQPEDTVLDAGGKVLLPGLVDMHVHLRDPGFTHKEDILTGCEAAAAGGVTSVACMPNTKPVADSPEVLRYILDHLGEELTVESLSKRFFISRYYLMHRFKAVTGYTVHQYISQKRLLRAGELIRAGVPVMKAAEQAGFPEYSTFLRAFQNTFHTSPKNFR